MATEIIGKVMGIPGDLYPNLRNYINSGSCKNAVISQALKDLAEYREVEDIEKIKEGLEKVEKEKKKLIKELRALKFRVISGKTLTLSDSQLERATGELKDGVKVSWIVKDTEIEI
jgi:predicted nuclease with TOPRIM domain